MSVTTLYETKSICPSCAVLDSKGFGVDNFIDTESFVEERTSENGKGEIWLRCVCKTHGSNETLLCSNSSFYHNLRTFCYKNEDKDNSSLPYFISNPLPGIQTTDTTNIDFIRKQMTNHGNENIYRKPFIVNLILCEKGKFISDKIVMDQINKWKKIMGNVKFILKLQPKLAPSMARVNQQVEMIANLFDSEQILLLEMSHDRLINFAKLQNSSFKNSKVYPVVKYYLQPGDEHQCRQELLELFNALKSFNGIRVIVMLSVSEPLPKLANILVMLRSKSKLAPLILFTMERSPKTLVEELFKKNQGVPLSKLVHLRTIDPYAVIESIRQASNDAIKESDFFPCLLSKVLEPLAQVSGYGRYSMNPDFFTGFMSCLVNTNKYRSRSLDELIDFKNFIREIWPLLPSLLKLKKGDNLGIFQARKLRQILKRNARKGIEIPDLISILLDRKQRDRVREFFLNMQFLVIYNPSDLFSIDIERRLVDPILQLNNNGNITSSTLNGHL